MKQVSFLWMRVGVVLILGLALVAGLAGTARAAEFDNDGKIGADEVIDDDVFLGGESVVMDGTVKGALFAAGETVTINGTVEGDLFAAGSKIVLGEQARVDGNLFAGSQVIDLHGNVTGSVFGGSAALTVWDTAVVARNLYYGGYSLTTEKGSQIARDAYFGVYQALLSGEIGRDVNGDAGALELAGSIGRNLTLEIEQPGKDGEIRPMPKMQSGNELPASVPSGLRVLPGAVIAGKLTYVSPVEQAGAIQAAPGEGVVYQKPVVDPRREVKEPSPWVTSLLSFVQTLVSLLVLGGLALWKLPGASQGAVAQVRQKPWASLGIGFLALLAGYAGVFIAALLIILLAIAFGVASLGGLGTVIWGVGLSALALAFAVFQVLVSYGSKLVVAYLVGEWVVRRFLAQNSRPRLWALVIGVLVYALLTAIPYLGGLIGFVVTLLGLGAIWLMYRAGRTPTAEIAVTETPAAPEAPAL